LIDENQSGFMRGRSISENFVHATEVVQCCQKRKAPAVVLKLNLQRLLTRSAGLVCGRFWKFEVSLRCGVIGWTQSSLPPNPLSSSMGSRGDGSI
jgi:hypothetical protein